MDLHFKNYQTMNTMAQCSTNMPPPYCLRPQSAKYPRIENYEPVWEDVRNQNQQQLLGTSGSKPYCTALRNDQYYRLDNRSKDCDEVAMDSEHDAKVGCSHFSRNYFFGKRNCAYKNRTRMVNGKIKYFCDDGEYCRDRDD